MKTFRTVILILVLTASQAVNADSWTVSIGSKHLFTDDEYNEFNPGLGYLKDLNSVIWYKPDYLTTGAYYNSIENISLYAGGGYQVFKRFSVEVGIVTGYYHDLAIGAIGAIDLGKVRVLVLPPVPAVDSPLVLGFQVKL